MPAMYLTGAASEGVLASILAVFRLIADWIIETIPTLYPLFYDPATGLTLIGVLSVASLAIGVVFLLIGVIQKFVHFRG